jgi:single-strand DNA-binding protein
MASMNIVILMGNLCADPERREAGSTSVTNLRLAINERYKTKSGDAKEIVTFIDAQVWGSQGEACAKHLTKGAGVIVEGKLRTQEWEKDGQKRSKTIVQAGHVTFLERGAGGGKPSGEEINDMSKRPRSSGSRSAPMTDEKRQAFEETPDDGTPF